MLDRLNEAYNEYQNITEDLSKYGNINKKAILDIRFFSLLCCYDIHLSYIKMNEAIISLAKSDESKWILIGQLEVLFLESLEKKRINFKDMKNIHQKMKTDYFNDYRKGCLIIAACYIYVRMKEQANQYLYSHYFDKRKMNNRYKAMHLGLLAIYEYIFNNNIHISIDYLEKQQFLYSKLGDSYKNIIIHNINVMRKRVPDVQVDFYVNNKLSNDTLYIDPRFF